MNQIPNASECTALLYRLEKSTANQHHCCVSTSARPRALHCEPEITRSSAARCHFGRADTTAVEFAICVSAAWLDSMAQDAAGIGVVHYEEVRRHLSTDAAHVHGGLLATLTAWCEQNTIPIRASQSAPSNGSSPAKAMPTRLLSSPPVRERGF